MLVTLEGPDGSGKSTLAAGLRDRFPDATFTREPTDSWYGEAVARSLGDDGADPVAELFLYAADHADHLSRVVRPALDRGDLVVSDRYADSRVAYQGATLADAESFAGDPVEYVRDLHEPFSLAPDLTVLLELDAETAAERSAAANKFERADYLERVIENYDRLARAEPERFVRVDATRPPETVRERAVAAVEARL
ncbi:MAG: dTMP kinase [Haloferacaceae archaeon]